MPNSKRCELQRVPVAFNILNPFERPLWEHVRQQVNRSRYIKRLIERDLQGGAQPVFMGVQEYEPEQAREQDLFQQFMGD